MKNLVKYFICLNLVFFSCTKESADNQNPSQSEELKINLDDVSFNFLNTTFFIEGDKEEILNEFLTKMDSNLFSKELFNNEKEIGIISWDISILNEKLLIKQSVKTFVEVRAPSCPSGLEEYASCSGISTEKCTKKKAGELAGELRTDETFSVTRTGFASTIVCGSPSLVDRC